MQLYLVDINEAVVDALRDAFASTPEVTIRHADILSVAENTLVSPANSHGYMDGGIDARYLQFFGREIQTTIRDAILRRSEQQLPVGASLAVRTGHPRIPFMIVAATMEMPEHCPAVNAYRSMRAVLRIADSNAAVGRAVFCPGLTTGVGCVPPVDAAAQMAEAYRDWKKIA